MIHQIRIYPDGVLRRIAKEVVDITDEIRRLAADMAETMCAARGVGLAANQIGLSLRMVAVETGLERESAPLVILNPVIVSIDGEDTAEEGCLSIPGFYENIKRARQAVVKGVNIDGKEFTIECSGLLARACQHELDHLNGVLFVDHLSPVKKQLFKREYAKEKK
jgi:peptide deformylase